MLLTTLVKANTGSNFLFTPVGHSTKRAKYTQPHTYILCSHIVYEVHKANEIELSFGALCLNGNICLVCAARSA
jgi:hypothetical protein